MSDEIRMPKHMRDAHRDRAFNVLAYWWFQQVGSTPMRCSTMLSRMHTNDVGHRAVMQFCEHPDPCKDKLAKSISKMMHRGNYECVTHDKRYRFRTIYSISGIQFQVMLERDV